MEQLDLFALVTLLQQKGVLTEQEIKSIRSVRGLRSSLKRNRILSGKNDKDARAQVYKIANVVMNALQEGLTGEDLDIRLRSELGTFMSVEEIRELQRNLECTNETNTVS